MDALAELAELAHGARVAELAVGLAEALGWDPADQGRLHQAARLHDVGKAALPDDLFSRPGPLTPPELEHVRQHAELGAGLAEIDRAAGTHLRPDAGTLTRTALAWLART